MTLSLLYAQEGVAEDLLIVTTCVLVLVKGRFALLSILPVLVLSVIRNPVAVCIAPLCILCGLEYKENSIKSIPGFVLLAAAFLGLREVCVNYGAATESLPHWTTEQDFTTAWSFAIWASNAWFQLVDYTIERMVAAPAVRIISYTPSLGMRWYLDAQMLLEHRTYFELLFVAQPVVCAWLIYTFISPKEPRVSVHLAFAILILFRRDLRVLDVLLGVVLLGQHADIVRNMKHQWLIVAGILVPLLASPVTFRLWAHYGTGNANYFFFQGVCLWLFAALGVTEFTAALLRKHAPAAKV